MTQTTNQAVGGKEDLKKIDYSFFDYLKYEIAPKGYETANTLAFKNKISLDPKFREIITSSFLEAVVRDNKDRYDKVTDEGKAKLTQEATEKFNMMLNNEIAKTSTTGEGIYTAIINRRETLGDTFASDTPNVVELKKARTLIEKNKSIFPELFDDMGNIAIGDNEEGLLSLNTQLQSNKELSNKVEELNVSNFISELSKAHNTNVRTLDDPTLATLFAVYNAKGSEGLTNYVNIVSNKTPENDKSYEQKSVENTFLTSNYKGSSLAQYMSNFANDFVVDKTVVTEESKINYPLNYNDFSKQGYSYIKEENKFVPKDGKEMFLKYATQYKFENVDEMYEDYSKGYENDNVTKLLVSLYADAEKGVLNDFKLDDILNTVASPDNYANYSQASGFSKGEGYTFDPKTDFLSKFATDILSQRGVMYGKSIYTTPSGLTTFQLPQQRQERLELENPGFTKDLKNDPDGNIVSNFVLNKMLGSGTLALRTVKDVMLGVTSQATAIFSDATSKAEHIRKMNKLYDDNVGYLDITVPEETIGKTAQFLIPFAAQIGIYYAGGKAIGAGLSPIAMRLTGATKAAEFLKTVKVANSSSTLRNIANMAKTLEVTPAIARGAKALHIGSKLSNSINITAFSAIHSGVSGRYDPIGSMYSSGMLDMAAELSLTPPETMGGLEEFYRKSNTMTRMALDVATDITIGLALDEVLSGLGRLPGPRKFFNNKSDLNVFIKEAFKDNNKVAYDLISNKIVSQAMDNLDDAFKTKLATNMAKSLEELFDENPVNGIYDLLARHDKQFAKGKNDLLALGESRQERANLLYQELMTSMANKVVSKFGGYDVAKQLSDKLLVGPTADALQTSSNKMKQVTDVVHGEASIPEYAAAKQLADRNSGSIIVSDGSAGFKVYTPLDNATRFNIELGIKLRSASLGGNYDVDKASFLSSRFSNPKTAKIEDVEKAAKEFDAVYGNTYITTDKTGKPIAGYIVGINKDGAYRLKFANGSIQTINPKLKTDAQLFTESIVTKKETYSNLLSKLEPLVAERHSLAGLKDGASKSKRTALSKEIKKLETEIKEIEDILIDVGDPFAKKTRAKKAAELGWKSTVSKFKGTEAQYKKDGTLYKKAVPGDPNAINVESIEHLKTIMELPEDEMLEMLTKAGMNEADAKVLIIDLTSKLENSEAYRLTKSDTTPLEQQLHEIYYNKLGLKPDDTLDDLEKLAVSFGESTTNFITAITNNPKLAKYVEELKVKLQSDPEFAKMTDEQFYADLHKSLYNKQSTLSSRIDNNNIEAAKGLRGKNPITNLDEVEDNLFTLIDDATWKTDVDAAADAHLKAYGSKLLTEAIENAYRKLKNIPKPESDIPYSPDKGAISKLGNLGTKTATAQRAAVYINLGLDNIKALFHKLSPKSKLVGNNLGDIKDYTPGVGYGKNIVVKVIDGTDASYYISKSKLKEKHSLPSQFVHTADGLVLNPDWARLGVNATIENGTLKSFVLEKIDGQQVFREARKGEAGEFYINTQRPKDGNPSDAVGYGAFTHSDAIRFKKDGELYYKLGHQDLAIPKSTPDMKLKSVNLTEQTVKVTSTEDVVKAMSKDPKMAVGAITAIAGLSTMLERDPNTGDLKTEQANMGLLGVLTLLALGSGFMYKNFAKVGSSSRFKFNKSMFDDILPFMAKAEELDNLISYASRKGIDTDYVSEDMVGFFKTLAADDVSFASIPDGDKWGMVDKMRHSGFLKTEESILYSMNTPRAIAFRDFMYNMMSGPNEMLGKMNGTWNKMDKSGYKLDEFYAKRGAILRPILSELDEQFKGLKKSNIEEITDTYLWARLNGADSPSVKHMLMERPFLTEIFDKLDTVEPLQNFMASGRAMTREVPAKMIKALDSIMDSKLEFVLSPDHKIILQKYRESGKKWRLFRTEDLTAAEKKTVSKNTFRKNDNVLDYISAGEGKLRFNTAREDYLPQVQSAILIQKQFQSRMSNYLSEGMSHSEAEKATMEEMLTRLKEVNDIDKSMSTSKFVKDYGRFMTNIEDRVFRSKAAARDYITNTLSKGLTDEQSIKAINSLSEIIKQEVDAKGKTVYKLNNIELGKTSSGASVKLQDAYMRDSIAEMLNAGSKGYFVKASTHLENSRSYSLPWDWADKNILSSYKSYAYDAGMRLNELENGIFNTLDLDKKYITEIENELRARYGNPDKAKDITGKLKATYMHIRDQNSKYAALPRAEALRKMNNENIQYKFIGALKRFKASKFLPNISFFDSFNMFGLGAVYTSPQTIGDALKLSMNAKQYKAVNAFADTYQMVSHSMKTFDDVLQSAGDDLSKYSLNGGWAINAMDKTSTYYSNFMANLGVTDMIDALKTKKLKAMDGTPPAFRLIPIINGFMSINEASTSLMTAQMLKQLDVLSESYVKLSAKSSGSRFDTGMFGDSIGDVKRQLYLLGVEDADNFVSKYQIYRKDLLSQIEKGEYDHDFMLDAHPEIAQQMSRITKTFKDSIHGTSKLLRPKSFENPIGSAAMQFAAYVTNVPVQMYKKRIKYPIDHFTETYAKELDKISMMKLLKVSGDVTDANIDAIARSYGISTERFADMLDNMPKQAMMYVTNIAGYAGITNAMYFGRDVYQDLVALPFLEDDEQFRRTKKYQFVNPNAKKREQVTWSEAFGDDPFELSTYMMVTYALLEKSLVVPGLTGKYGDIVAQTSYGATPVENFPLGATVSNLWDSGGMLMKGIKEGNPTYFAKSANGIGKELFDTFSPLAFTGELNNTWSNKIFSTRKKRSRPIDIDGNNSYNSGNNTTLNTTLSN